MMDLIRWIFVVGLAVTLIIALIEFITVIGPNPDFSGFHPLLTIAWLPVIVVLCYFVLKRAWEASDL